MSYNDNPRFIEKLSQSATHILRVANQRQREQARIDRSVLGNKSGKVTKLFDAQKPIRPLSAQEKGVDIGDGEVPPVNLNEESAHLQNHGPIHSTIAIPSLLPASARPVSRAKSAIPKVKVTVKSSDAADDSKIDKESIIANLRGAVASQALAMAPESVKTVSDDKTLRPQSGTTARVPYVYQKPKAAAETLKAFTTTLVDFDRKIIPDVEVPPDPIGLETLRKFPLPISSAVKTMRKLKDKKRGGAMRNVDVGATETTYHGLKRRFRSEEEREKMYEAYMERKKLGMTKTKSFDTLGLEIEDEEVVERHPLFVNTMHIIFRENYLSRDRTRRRLLARRFNLDVRDVWLSNLRHIAEMKYIENAYTLAQGYDDDDEDVPVDDEEQHKPSAFEVAKSKLSAVAEELEIMPDRGLNNRRDVRALEEMGYQIQSVSNARAMNGAYHSHYLADPRLVLDYVCEPTPMLRPPPPLPPILDSLVNGYPLQATSLIVRESLQSAKTSSSAHIMAWKSKAAPATLPEKLHNVKPVDNDVYLYVDRLIPEYDCVRMTSSSGSGADNSIFWRLSVMRLGDVATTYVLGKEIEVAEYIGSLWAEEDDQQYEHVDELHPEIVQDLEWINSHAGGKEPLTIAVFEEEIAVPVINSYLDTGVDEEVYVQGSRYDRLESNHDSPFRRRRNVSVAIFVISKQGKMVPYCSSAANETEYFCRAHRTIDIEIHVRFEKDIQNNNQNVNFESSDDPEVIIEAADYDDNNSIDVVLMTSPIELRQLLHVPIAPLSDVAWWISDARSTDIWPAVCALLQLQVKQDENADDLDNINLDRNREQYEQVYTLDFVRSKAHQKLLDRTDGALSASQAYAIAHELVSRVVVQFDHASREMSLFIPGAPLSLLTATGKRPRSSKSNKSRIANQFQDGGSWEMMVSSVPSLSLLAAGGVPLSSQVPGASEVGSRGFWLKPPPCCPREETRVAAIYFRDALVSSSDSVIVRVTHAIDVPIRIPVMLAWEGGTVLPPKILAEEVLDWIPLNECLPQAILQEKLISPLDRLSETVMIFTGAAKEGYDFVPRDLPMLSVLTSHGTSVSGGLDGLSFNGFRRHRPVYSQYGFRHHIELSLLEIDAVNPTYIFGMTNLGATLNEMLINPRNIWKSNLVVTEFVNRERLPRDYHYIIASTNTSGLSDRFIHVIVIHGEEFIRLDRIPGKEFDKHNAIINERRNFFNRQLALDTVIERSAMNLKVREKQKKLQMAREVQVAFEKKMKKASQTEKSWATRFMYSSVVDLRGFWEKRRDDRNGLIFFHRRAMSSTFGHSEAGDDYGRNPNEPERFRESCQWEVPLSFESMPLLAEEVNDFDSLATLDVQSDELQLQQKQRQQHAEEAARIVRAHGGTVPQHSPNDFAQPTDDWYPGMDQIPTDTGGITPQMNFLTRRGQAMGPKSGAISVPDSGTSVGGLKSEGDYTGATIDTQHLEHIAEQLVSSDELMRALARRLGLSEKQVVPAGELASVFSVDEATIEEIDKDAIFHAPRDNFLPENLEPEHGSDDDLWSDDEIEAGDGDPDDAVDVPGNRGEAATLRRRKLREAKEDIATTMPRKDIPYLNLIDHKISSKLAETNINVLGWKRLPRPDFNVAEFYDKMKKKRTQGPDPTICNTLNIPIILAKVAPSDATRYEPESFTAEYVEIFVPDVDLDVRRAVGMTEIRMRLEDKLKDERHIEEMLLSKEPPSELTTVDKAIVDLRKAAKEQFIDPKVIAIEKAIQAAKSSNIAEMEDALEYNINPDSADQFGNTLLILACQQGSKRMVKFLLRRGATINQQNGSGNTALHYCYAYHNNALGDYLIKRGASDIIVNNDGLTCYEGLDASYVAIWDGKDQEDLPDHEVLRWKT